MTRPVDQVVAHPVTCIAGASLARRPTGSRSRCYCASDDELREGARRAPPLQAPPVHLRTHEQERQRIRGPAFRERASGPANLPSASPSTDPPTGSSQGLPTDPPTRAPASPPATRHLHPRDPFLPRLHLLRQLLPFRPVPAAPPGTRCPTSTAVSSRTRTDPAPPRPSLVAPSPSTALPMPCWAVVGVEDSGGGGGGNGGSCGSGGVGGSCGEVGEAGGKGVVGGCQQ
ncbi:unnamed protein product [Closterium sp. NIES-65]|nr:unnamed protein product [Closterium sp. NIES-65]